MFNLLAILSPYKWALIGIGLLISHAAVWHVSATYTESKYLGKQLDVANAIIETNGKNQTLKNDITKSVTEAMGKWSKLTEQSNRKLQNEIAKDPVYRDCKSSPSVMREYQNKLDNQP